MNSDPDDGYTDHDDVQTNPGDTDTDPCVTCRY